MTINKLAKIIGFNQSNLSKIVRGDREPNMNLLQAMADNTDVNLQWLMTGTGDMLARDVAPLVRAETEEYHTTNSGMRYRKTSDGRLLMSVNLVDVIALGSPDDEFAELYKVDADRVSISIEVDEVHHGRYLAFRVEGDSMDDGTRKSFERGDIVVVRELARDKWLPKLHIRDWPFWVVCFGNCVRIKQIIAQDETSITLHSINPSPEFTDFTLNLDDVQRLFNVVRKVPKDVIFG